MQHSTLEEDDLAFWQDVIDDAQQFRRALHRHPELSWQEEKTAAHIRARLTELDIPWRACAGTGTLALLNGDALSDARTGRVRHVALRGDIDALPINEQSGQSWSSEHQGCMHACGHDGHTASLLGTARWLKYHEAELTGPVSLLFQPAEEGGHGARRMIEDGALDGVDEIYGWHNWPAIPFGELLCPDQLVMCGNGTFSLHIEGQGGHASQPELCQDPVLAASAITLALQQIISRRLPPQETAVVSVTSIDAPSGLTVIPQTAKVSGSIRVSNDRVRQLLNNSIEEISRHVAQGYGVTCAVDIQPRYDATINHAEQAQRMRQCWQQLFGEASLNTSLALPVMASEDFSYYLKEVPGAFALIGANDGERQHQVPCHSPFYDFNDRLIPRVVALYAGLLGISAPV